MKTAIVTGATGAIGKAIASQLADKNYRVFLACRDENKTKAAVEEIKRKTGNENVYYEIVDLSREKSIVVFASRWEGKLDVLINNAAATPRKRSETPEGIEMQFATNVLGYFWMILNFYNFMKDSHGARIVNVASYWAGGLDVNDLEFKNKSYNNDDAYRQSKQADRMLSFAFAEKLKPFGISVNSCHPGDVNSKLSNDLGFGGHETPDQGAKTPLWLAASPEVEGITGKYFEHLGEVNCRFCDDKNELEELFKICLKYSPLSPI